METLKQQLNGEKRRKMRRKAKTRIRFWLSFVVLVSGVCMGTVLKTITNTMILVSDFRNNLLGTREREEEEFN